ncbi:MAG: hypothetical protein P4L10_07490 [Acidobacteriaceae bacterium]|nr:hypothetical protein [Acidobacteriaceae bacterium]
MSTQVQVTLAQQVEEAAKAAGLSVTGTAAGADFNGAPTTKFTLALDGQSTTLELSDDFDFQNAQQSPGVAEYMAAAAKRLKNPVPDVYLTLLGVPLRFGRFSWPFHKSTSGADTSLVHGEIKLEDGKDSPLYAKVAASITLTFMEILPALQQPYAEGFIYNAVRKVLDQGQLELVKTGGNRQTVAVTTRYYSTKKQQFVFNDTNAAQRKQYLAAKVFWLSGALGESKPLWIADNRDAQYLNTTVAELQKTAEGLAAEGVIGLQGEYATPTAKLMAERPQYEAKLEAAVEFTRPKFNEEMRQGHTNM